MVFLSGNERYTLSGDRVVERYIHNIIESIARQLIQEIKPTSVVLCGSLGRGEATAYPQNGTIHLISDLEIGCVDSNWLKRVRLKKMESFLAEKHDVDLTLNFFLPRRFSLGVPANWAPVGSPLSIDQYELLKTTRFIYGKDLKNNAKNVNSVDIPLWEGIRLLFNRMAELIEAILLELPILGRGIVKSCCKLLIASGDALLLISKLYHHLYNERSRRFQYLSESTNPSDFGNLSKDEINLIIQAYSYKLYPQTCKDIQTENLILDSINVSEKVFKFLIHYEMGLKFSSYEEFYIRYLSHPKLKKYSRTNPKLENIISLLKANRQMQPFSFKEYFRSKSVLHTIYAQLPLWLYGYIKSEIEINGYCYMKKKVVDLQGRSLIESWKRYCL